MPDNEAALVVPDNASRQNLHKALSEMLITISDQMFQNRDIYIDGYRFINCSFINCKLMILRGTFEFHHCLIKEGTKLWMEDALKCIQFYTISKPDWRATPGFAGKTYTDGTFSIAKGVSIE